jgi:beta-lactamase regulating signal transducer with metallopeptidase domain
MNLILESLNQWGVQALRVAWPMLWQSSLLIGLLFAAEALLRHRVRAAVRYALWLVVLLKLVLPPALALPTGLGWWLRPTAVRSVPAAAVSVTFNESAPQSFEAAEPVAATPLPEPTATLGLGGWVLLGSSAVSLALLGWMLLRWRQVTRDLREATAAPESVCKLAEELRVSLGLRQDVRIRLTERAVSPGVCGLFRPVILLPRLVTERLAPAQLRAVLLHELIHLRRGDVWVNCGQALLQLAYWWHPLVWLTNVRIRQLREEAVDDAVMLALREEAETYAPTLLEVARLALRRQMPSLGLVGILESRNALRQRIQRLLEFHPPRRAGLTLASAFAVLAFAALAVPMGEAPSGTNDRRPDVVVPGSILVPRERADPFPSGLEPGTTNPVVERSDRDFRIELSRLQAAVQATTGRPTPADAHLDVEGLVEFFKTKGVDLTPPKLWFYTEGHGILKVRASKKELNLVQEALAAINGPPSQLHIQARLLEVSKLEAAWFCTQFGATNEPGSAVWSVNLSAAQTAEQLARWQVGAATLTFAPEAVTLSGREVAMKTTEQVPVLTRTNAVTQTNQVEVGPVLDILPNVGGDGYTVFLSVVASLREFIGYTEPVTANFAGALTLTPQFRTRRLSVRCSVLDGQTVVLGGMTSQVSGSSPGDVPTVAEPLAGRFFRGGPGAMTEKQALLLLTARLVTPTGDPVHSDEVLRTLPQPKRQR